jgi:hypothetical protein
VNLVLGYLNAKEAITKAGYGEDIDWAENLILVKPDPVYVLREYAWVVVNSGFRYQVARKLWPRLLDVFHGFDPQLVSRADVPEGLKVLNHEGKIEAIRFMAHHIRQNGIQIILDSAVEPKKLQAFPWIGKITCWHFAKVLGMDVVKPDVHLTRAAAAAGHESPLALARAIKEELGEPLTVVDSVLWRYGEQRIARNWPDWPQLFVA